MNKKGFTLVELLAVIVILAVIALITIPAVMKMIDNATTNSYRRSIDLYGKAVSQAIISYESDMVEKNKPINITFENIDSYIEYEGNDVDCKDKTIYSDRTILLTQCYVQEELVYAEKGRGYGEENYYYYTNSKKKMKVIKYIEAVEEALQGKNINRTCQVQEDKIVCNNEEITIKSKLENAIEGSLVIENNKVKSYNNLKFATEKKIETNNEIPQVIDEQNTSNDDNETIASEDIDYKGYYADVDGDGEADGIIYADLAHTKEETSWGRSNIIISKYSYDKGTNLKKYIVNKNKYKANDGFGTKQIISVKSGSTGNARFYVMALEDFRTGSFEARNEQCSNNLDCAVGTYYWYYNALYKMSTYAEDTKFEFGTGYANTGKIIEIWNKNGTGTGSYIGATQDDHDMWKHIQTKYAEGWYIPSIGEWAAFADYLTQGTDNSLTNDCSTNSCSDNGNYDDLYGLSSSYWSSSQDTTRSVWFVAFSGGSIYYYDVSQKMFVRLGATF